MFETGTQRSNGFLDHCRQVEAAAALGGLVDRNLLERVHQFNRPLDRPVGQIDHLAAIDKKIHDLSARQRARLVAIADFLHAVTQRRYGQLGVAQGCVELMRNAGDHRTQRRQLLRMHQFVTRAFELVHGFLQRTVSLLIFFGTLVDTLFKRFVKEAQLFCQRLLFLIQTLERLGQADGNRGGKCNHCTIGNKQVDSAAGDRCGQPTVILGDGQRSQIGDSKDGHQQDHTAPLQPSRCHQHHRQDVEERSAHTGNNETECECAGPDSPAQNNQAAIDLPCDQIAITQAQHNQHDTRRHVAYFNAVSPDYINNIKQCDRQQHQ